MKYVLLCAAILVIIFCGCQKDPAAISEPISPPDYTVDPNLSVAEILQQQNIRSLHFLQWDSLRVNGELRHPFIPSWEIYIDARRFSLNKYDQLRRLEEVTVMNLDEGEAFKYSYAEREFLDFIGERDTLEAFESIAKMYLTSKLPCLEQNVGFEYINRFYCQVNVDSRENREWIWVEHKLPIKWQVTFSHDSTEVISNREYRDIQINK